MISLFTFMIPAQQQTEPEFDILILNGRLLDGTGNPWIQRDIAISGNHIAAIGRFGSDQAKTVIDATGLYVAPGFIDTHSHAASGLSDPELSSARPLLAQGISTVIVNPDGSGAVDLPAQQQRLTEHGLGVHVAQMIPHGSIRNQVMGMDDRAPTADELERMLSLAAVGMKAGAVGMSTGLFYAPASFSETDEIIEFARVVNQYDGVHQSHIRDESNYSVGVVAAVQEIIDISEASGITGVVSHVKALGPGVWGKSEEIVRLIDDARENKGLQIFADQYPYEASATGLMAALVPRWAAAGGRSAFLDRIADPETRVEIITGINENLERRGGADRIVMRHVPFNHDLEGVSLQEISESMDLTPAEATLNLLEQGSPGIVSFNMHEQDIERFMVQPWVMTASDGGFVAKGEGVPHPRNYGSFPRRIRVYSIERQVTDLASAIRSMTSLPATVYRLPERGLIKPGYFADIVIFDPKTIRDNATFTDPHQLSSGVVWMFINGKPAIREREFTGTKAGEILQRHGNRD
jgi:N-acyl-D-amino-acid deacylase